ncbi:MAG: bifunctional diaminohydroxyphosphoribosylaminopyrimidine deaminase/5-amino-6-(5-phosphoribosylamino)uracil reductase RibD [Bacteroidia bacterium]
MNLCQPQEEKFLRRAAQLAQYASPLVEPNPYVGAVLACEGRVVTEAFHHKYGEPHAEALLLAAYDKVPPGATVYLTLEPCCHTQKKTPPCAPMLVAKGVRRVVVGALDPNPHVAGRGIALLKENGVEVLRPTHPQPYQELLRHFYVNQTLHRPYITLKWATDHGRALGRHTERLVLTDSWAQPYVHRLRAKHSHIAVGNRTYQIDKPRLTVRSYWGPSPKPILFSRQGPYRLENLALLLRDLYQTHNVGSILVEGGRHILEIFLAAGLYDEIHILEMPGSVSAEIYAPFPPELPYQVRHVWGSQVRVLFWARPLAYLEF